jgi:hypothetical protein
MRERGPPSRADVRIDAQRERPESPGDPMNEDRDISNFEKLAAKTREQLITSKEKSKEWLLGLWMRRHTNSRRQANSRRKKASERDSS